MDHQQTEYQIAKGQRINYLYEQTNDSQLLTLRSSSPVSASRKRRGYNLFTPHPLNSSLQARNEGLVSFTIFFEFAKAVLVKLITCSAWPAT